MPKVSSARPCVIAGTWSGSGVICDTGFFFGLQTLLRIGSFAGKSTSTPCQGTAASTIPMLGERWQGPLLQDNNGAIQADKPSLGGS